MSNIDLDELRRLLDKEMRWGDEEREKARQKVTDDEIGPFRTKVEKLLSKEVCDLLRMEYRHLGLLERRFIGESGSTYSRLDYEAYFFVNGVKWRLGLVCQYKPLFFGFEYIKTGKERWILQGKFSRPLKDMYDDEIYFTGNPFTAYIPGFKDEIGVREAILILVSEALK